MAFPSRIRLRTACLLVVVAALALAMPAAAAASAQSHKRTGTTSMSVSSKGGGGASGNRSGLHGKVVGGLPFTGLDVIALAAIAVSLTSTGLALRRISIDDGEPA
jgi:hypothetical protein